MQTGTRDNANMAQRIARPIHVVVAALLVIGLLFQVFLAGLGVFAGSANFETHRDFGFTLTIVPFVLIITGLVGRYGRWQVTAAVVVFLQFILQSLLVAMRSSTPQLAALHPVNGFLMALIAAWLLLDAWRRFNGPVGEESAAA